MSCVNDLLANFDENCDIQINGIDDRLFIVPFNSIDKIATLAAFQKEPELLLTDLVMKAGKSIFYCVGKSSVVPSTTFSRTTNSHQTKHEVRFKVFKDDPATRANLERLKEGKFLIIVQFADGTFDTYGLYQGMYMTEMPYTPADSATNRVYSIAFASLDTAQEPFGSVNLLKVSNSATLLYLETLVYVDVVILPVSLEEGTQSVAYTQTITQEGLVGTPVWSIASGSLPAGIALNSATGVLAGTPTGFGTFNFVVSVTDGVNTGNKSYTLVIIAD